MLNVTDQYCISPATSKGGFSCHPGDLSRKCHLCHGSSKSRKRDKNKLQDVQSKISHNGFVLILCPSKQSSFKARLRQHQ